MASRCQCCSATETTQHLFIDSPIAVQVWGHFSDIFHITLRPLESFQYRFQAWRFSGQFVRQGHIRMIVLILILWYIWTARNDAKYRDITMEPRRIIWRVYRTFSLLRTGRLFWFIHWRGDMDVAPLFGVSITSSSHSSPVLFFWRSPPVGSYKINIDGSVKEGFASGGGLLEILLVSVFELSTLSMVTALSWRLSFGLFLMGSFLLRGLGCQFYGLSQTLRWLYTALLEVEDRGLFRTLSAISDIYFFSIETLLLTSTARATRLQIHLLQRDGIVVATQSTTPRIYHDDTAA
ncbi:Uncharacterized protein Adt_37568 [Abeliophyllum distichum]|uniref:Uncharacterized protein n=1 Tax=Abeliophyllum distichum TaxID=126358 RepID=A0ABD1Q0Q4_9LAMI